MAVQNSPVWVRCKYDGKSIDEEDARYVKANKGMELMTSDHIHKFVPQGHTTALFNPLTGGQYCPRAPKSSQELQRQRLVAKASTVVKGIHDATWWQQRLEERHERDLSDREDEPPKEGGKEDLPAAQLKKKALEKKRSLFMTSLYTSMMPPPPLVPGTPTDDCRLERLTESEMLGVVVKVGPHQHYALCCFCGDLIHLSDEKWMTNGISCMNHPHADEFAADHFHTIAFLPTTNPILSAYAHDAKLHPSAAAAAPVAANASTSVLKDPHLRSLYRHPHVLDHPVRCDWCQERETRCVLHVFDPMFRLREFAICDDDLASLQSFLGPIKMGHLAAPGKPIEIISLTLLIQRLKEVATRRLRTATAPPSAAKRGAGGEKGPAPQLTVAAKEKAEAAMKAEVARLDECIRQCPVPRFFRILQANPMLQSQYKTAQEAPLAQRLLIYSQVLAALDAGA
jgi:hypothetical protein